VERERTRGGPAGHALPGRPGRSRLRARIRHLQLRTRVLAGVLVVTLAVLAGFGFAAVTALQRYMLAETDSNLRTILNEYHPLLTPSSTPPSQVGGVVWGELGGLRPLEKLFGLTPTGDELPAPNQMLDPSKIIFLGPEAGPQGEGPDNFPSPALPVQEIPITHVLLPTVVDGYDIELISSGRVEPYVGGDPDLVPRLPATLAEVAAHGGALTVMSRNGRAQLRLTAASSDGKTLVVATSLQGVDSTLSQLRLIVAFGVLASALLVLAGTGLVVRRGLRPVEKMAAAADKITAGDLASRVAPHDPVTEVGRLGTALNRMLDRVQASVREREASEQATRQFFADASHELRTPLASLRANAELYQQGALSRRPQVDEAMRRITAEARRMGALVDSMLRLARLDQQPLPRREPVDLSALILECTQRARTASRWHDWRPSVAVGLVATGDEEMLRRALDNLLANIAAHTPAGTTATITAAAVDGIITVEVSDDGPGVPADQLPRIFDRFYRAPAPECPTGSGLGLAIVTAIAAAHRGAVHASPSHPHGLCVTLTLPAYRPAATAQPRARVRAHAD
jgi:two-component system, OmpR family, sensor kinase